MTLLVKLKKICVVLNQQKILSNISLKLQSKKITTIIGPNGAGKSTLARVVLKLIIPTQGKSYYLPKLRIGYVPQKFFINKNLPIKVNRFMQNKFFYNKKKENILSLLKSVKAEFLIDRSLHTLSVGEVQRILLARALLNNPQLLVLDEPTQGVDLNGQILLYDLIHKLRFTLNCGILMISHDLNLIMAKTDEVLCLNKKICCFGTPEIVLNHPEFTKMFAIYYHNHSSNKLKK